MLVAVASVRYQLRLLGAPVLSESGAARALPGRRAWALLACVALERGLTRARAASLLWPELDEPSARRNLRRELARLKEAGLGDLLASTGDLLALAPGVGCDAAEFAVACEADPELALALAQGPLLEGFELGDAPAFDAWLAERRDAHARRWRSVAGGAAQAREAGGDLRGALELRLRLIDADALAEPEVAHAMRLHEQLGDRTAALALYERCRRALADELGLEPLAETTALAERLRTHERVAPVLPRAVRPAWERLDAPLVGRDAEAARLRDTAAPVLLVEGDAGVGKTRLAQETLRARHTVVLRCTAADRGGALQPVAAVLADARSRLASAERLSALSAATRAELSRLVPDFAEGLPPPAHADAAAQRRFLDALADALDALCGGGTWLVDDLHWADEGTLALVRHAAHRRAREPARHARVVATARSAELAADAQAGPAVLALEREGLLERLPLAPLAESDTLALVRELSGSEGGTLFAQRLQRTTAGNPYHLLETLRFLFDAGELEVDERGGWRTRYDDATADYAELPVPPSVAQTVVERLDRLGAAARRVLEAAALAGDGFTLDDVQPATALSEFEALDGLERALDARLIAEADPGYRFVHDLARSAIDARLGPERRRRVHGRLAQGLIARRGRPGRIAQHLEGAGERAAAVPWRLKAAHAAQAVFARLEALGHLDAALANGAEGDERLECHTLRFRMLRMLGRTPEAQAEAARVVQLAAPLGPGAHYRAAVVQAFAHVDFGRYAEALAVLDARRGDVAPDPADALTLWRLGGTVALHLDRGAEAEAWLSRALELSAQQRGAFRLDIESQLIHTRLSGGALDAAASLCTQALARVSAQDSPLDVATLWIAASRVAESQGDLDGCRQALERAIALMADLQSPLSVFTARVALARVLADHQCLDEARGQLAAVQGHTQLSPRFRYAVELVKARLSWGEGRADEALACLAAAVDMLDEQPAVAVNGRATLARYRALAGDLDGALAVAEAAAAAAGASPPLLAVEAVRAWHALAAGQAAAVAGRLESVLRGPTALDEYWALHQAWVRALLGAARLALGDRPGAQAAVHGLRAVGAIEALAWTVRLAAGDPPAGARALLAAGAVPPVERALLERALADGRPFA